MTSRNYWVAKVEEKLDTLVPNFAIKACEVNNDDFEQGNVFYFYLFAFQNLIFTNIIMCLCFKICSKLVGIFDGSTPHLT